MKKILYLLLSLLLTFSLVACGSKEETSEDDAKYEAGYSLSLGYNLPSITFEDGYDDWDLSDDYFGGKKVDEAYIPKYDTNKKRIAIYRNKIKDQTLEEFVTNEVTSNAYDLTEGVVVTYLDEDKTTAYYSLTKEIDDELYFAEEYFYTGTSDFVNLEYLTPMSKIDINNTGLYIYLPANYIDQSLDDYIYSYYDEDEVLPSIYISGETINDNSVTEEEDTVVEVEEIDLDDYSYDEYIEDNEDTNTTQTVIDYHSELQSYLDSMYELFEISNEEFSSLVNVDQEVETLLIDYNYVVDENNYYAKELDLGLDNYLYSIMLCSDASNQIQISNARIFLNTISFN